MPFSRGNSFCFGFLLLGALTFLCPLAHAFNSHKPFDISADIITYVDADQEITADGHVVVVQGTSTLTTDHLVYKRLNRHLLAQGHVTLRDKGTFLSGDTLDYDLDKEQGTVSNALTYKAPWVIEASTWDKHEGYYIGRDASFTSCDLMDPHYHIRSSRIHLIPDEYFWSWNNIGYVDTLPVFYSPFMYKNLENRRVVMQFQPGNDDVNGNFVKTLTTIRLTDLVYDKVYYDIYSNTGNGVGDELDYSKPGKMKGSLFGYYINPHGDAELAGSPDIPQYNYRAYHWQQLAPTVTLQANANFRNNIQFNNQYFPQDTNQAVSDIASSIALTQQTKKYNQRLVMEADQAPDPTDTSQFAATHIQSASLPRYDVTMYERPLWKRGGLNPTISTATLTPGTTAAPVRVIDTGHNLGPLLLSSNFSAGQTYTRLNERIQTNSNGSATLSESMPLGRYFSFTPSLSPQVNWQDKYTAQSATATAVLGSTTPIVGPIPTLGEFRGFQGRLGTSDTMRWRPTSAFTLDQTYQIVGRFAPNDLSLDRTEADDGIETNHVSWLAYWRPNRRVLLRSYSGYDLRTIEGEDPNAYRQRRVDPWTTEFTYDPNRKSEYFFRYQLGYFPTRDKLWEGDYNVRGPYQTTYTTGLLYNEGTQGLMTWNNSVGIYFSPSWRVDAVIHTYLSDFTGSQPSSLIDESFIVTRDMHCWTMQFVYRNLPGLSRQYSVLFNLKLGVTQQEEITNPDLESQFYPWRTRTYVP